MLSLFHAGLLPWIIAASIPVIIHLLTRRARLRRDLPTVKFLQRTLSHQSRLFRWRHLIVLILRTLAVAALVLAFTRPAWLSSLSARGERVGEVVVLDVSESMAYSAGGVSTFAKAQGQAVSSLDALHPGDLANVVMCGAQPAAALSDPTRDIGMVQNAVRSAQVTDERADAAGAINVAVEQLAKTNTKIRRLVIVSDFQRTNWSDVKLEAVPANTRILFLSVDSGNRENTGITALRVRPAVPRVGETVTAQAEVFNSGSAAKTVSVDLRLNNGEHYTNSATVGPFSSANVSFPLTFDHPQRAEVTAAIGSDNMPSDNIRRTVIDLQQMATVVLITDEDLNASTSAAFYLARALHPDLKSSSGFRVVPIRPSQLNNPTLKSADAVLVCGAPSMPDIQLEALARYAAGGGNLVWFLYGDRVGEQIAGLSRRLPANEPAPLRIESAGMDLSKSGKGFVTLSEARYESRLLKAFRDPAAAGLNKARFTRLCVTSEPDPRAELLLKFEDGTPAVVLSGEGSGNLLLVNMSPAPAWSDLARQPVFLPLMHEFLKGIVLREMSLRDTYPGGPASTTIGPASGRLTCTDPEGDMVPVTLDKTTGSVVVERAKRSGFYHLTAAGEDVGAISVNPHPDETDLRSIDPRELESARQKQLSYLQGASGEASAADIEKGRPLWHYLLFLALACLFAEQGVSRLAPRKRPSREAGV